MMSLRNSNAKPSLIVSYLWASMLCDNDLVKSSQEKSTLKGQQCPTPIPTPTLGPTPDPIETPEVNVTIGPLLVTEWDQYYPYNTYCPVLSGGSSLLNGHAYTGCVTTAMAQIMAYWKYPSGYLWTSMISKYPDYDEIARLMGNIFPYVITNYNTSGSGDGNPSTNIVSTFKNYFGYSTASYKSYAQNNIRDYNILLTNLSNKQPVLLGGKNSSDIGHAWVCD